MGLRGEEHRRRSHRSEPRSRRRRAAPTAGGWAGSICGPPGSRVSGKRGEWCAVSAVPLFPVSRKCRTNVMKKTNIQSEGRQPFNPMARAAYVSPFSTARQFCSSCRLPFACFSSNSASSTKFFLNAATLLVLKSISSCFADSDIFSNF